MKPFKRAFSLPVFPALGIACVVSLRFHVFPRLAKLVIDYMCSLSLKKLHIFPCLASVLFFLALGTASFLSSTMHWSHIFPRFPTSYIFSCASHRFHVFPRFAPVTCFPTHRTGYIFHRASHRFHVFPPIAPVTCFRFPRLTAVTLFPALGTPYMSPSSTFLDWSHVFTLSL